MNAFKIVKLVAMISVVFMSTNSCDSDPVKAPENSCTPIANASDFIELVYPVGGETFTKGSTITVLWKVNKTKISSVVLRVSVDGGKNYTDVVSSGIATPASTTDFSCMEYKWVIGSEYKTVSYKTTEPTTVLLSVEKYGEIEVAAVSTGITITP
jgi:hypothetical protein